MDNLIHQQATRFALESLPEWEKKILKGIKMEMVELHSLYPDIYKWKKAKNTHDNAVRYGRFALKETGRYSLLPNGKDPDFYTHRGLHDALDYYLRNMIAALKNKHMQEFSKYAGSYSHYLLDAISPAHIPVTDNDMLRLLPPPQHSNRVYLSFHWIIEMIPFEILAFPKYKPRLKGNNVEASIFFLREAWLACINKTVAQHIPIIQALYRGNVNEVEKRKRRMVAEGIKVLADTLHTAFSLAHERGTEKPVEQEVSLTKCTPCGNPGFDPFYRGQAVKNRSIYGVDERGWKKGPLKLKVNNGRKVCQRRFEHGLGMGIPTRIIYHTDKIFKKFRAMIGFHAELGKKGIGRFRILGNGRGIYDSGIMRGGESARVIDIDVGEIEKLELRAEEVKVRYGANGWSTEDHLVLAEPVLVLPEGGK